MNSADIIAWHLDGAAYCPDCEPEGAYPVFADSLESEHGATCNSCGACLMSAGEWYPYEDAVGESVRWSECDSCGSQKPWVTSDYGFRTLRRMALLGQAVCEDCLQPTLHFRRGWRDAQ